MKSGVYFLLSRNEIVYIGQTNRWPLRFNMTNSEFDFDRIRLIECPKKKALFYERRWIKKFNPKYNKVHTKSHSYPMTGKTNPNGGRVREKTVYDNMLLGQRILYVRKIRPEQSIAYFNKQRDKKLSVLKVGDTVFIERIK